MGQSDGLINFQHYVRGDHIIKKVTHTVYIIDIEYLDNLLDKYNITGQSDSHSFSCPILYIHLTNSIPKVLRQKVCLLFMKVLLM